MKNKRGFISLIAALIFLGVFFMIISFILFPNLEKRFDVEIKEKFTGLNPAINLETLLKLPVNENSDVTLGEMISFSHYNGKYDLLISIIHKKMVNVNECWIFYVDGKKIIKEGDDCKGKEIESSSFIPGIFNNKVIEVKLIIWQ